jgi:hypothetical protein
MKILFFITMHRQLDELKIYSYFFNKFNHIKNFDIFIYNTNKNISEQMVRNNLNLNTKVYVHCDTNNEGYVLGLFSGLSQNYDLYREYDFIVHLHPDVFILDDKKLYELLIDQKDKDIDFLVSQVVEAPFAYLTDLFIFKPKNNFISKYINYRNLDSAEKILFSIIEGNNLKKYLFSRYPNDEIGGKNREIDEYNIWHEHKLENVLNYIHNIK